MTIKPPTEPVEPDKDTNGTVAIPVNSGASSDATLGETDGSALSLLLQPFSKVAGLVWDSGIACMAVASSIQSFSALLVKLTDGRVPIFEIVAVRSLICMCATYVLIRMQGLPHVLGGMQYLLAKFIRGFAGAVSMSIYYYGVFHLSLSDTVTIFFSHPAMVVLLAWIVRGEVVRWTALLGILLSMLGVVLVSKPPFFFGGTQWTSSHVSGVVACLCAAFTAAIAFVSVRFIPKTEPSICVAAWFHLMGLLTAGIPLMLGIPEWPVLPILKDSMCVVGVGISSFLSHVLIARSLQIETAAKASAAGFLQVVFAYTYGLAFLGEAVQLLSVAGSVVICSGVIATSWPQKAAATDYIPVQLEDIDEAPTSAGAIALVEVEQKLSAAETNKNRDEEESQ